MKRILQVVTVLFLGVGLGLSAHAHVGTDPEPAVPDSSDESTNALETPSETGLSADAAPQEEPTLDVSVNGSLRFNALFRSYGGEQADKVLGNGGFTFDTFRIGTSGSYGRMIFDAEYAFYPESFGGMFLHHGWVGYEFSEAFQAQVGVSQVPFGIQPYASSSWFFNATYYVGLEDDYDAGVKAIYQANGWDVQAAYYLNAEQTDFFAGTDFSRYSYDVAPVGSANYQVVPGGNSIRSDISEENQFNAKVAYTVSHEALGFTKVGVSGQVGQLLNRNTGATDSHSAYALHLQGRYGGFEAKLEYAQQNLNPPLTNGDRTRFANQSGVNYDADDFVVMGAYAFPQRVASEHTVYSSSLAYHVPVQVGPISEIKPYYDFSAVTKDVEGWNDNATHDIGFLTTAGPVFVYTDLNISKGHPFNHPGANFTSVMAEQNDNEWRTAFNINIGIYF